VPRPIRVAALQPRTFEARDHLRACEALLTRIDQGITGHALLVLPEAAIPGWALLAREAVAALNMPGEEEWFSALAERSRRTGCAIAAGIVRRDADGALRNELLLAPQAANWPMRASVRSQDGSPEAAAPPSPISRVSVSAWSSGATSRDVT